MSAIDNVLSNEQIIKINNFIDEHYPYDKYMFVFPNVNPEFKSFFLKNISEELKEYIDSTSYIVLRIVNEHTSAQEYQFHFDTYFETILVPLLVCEGEKNGDLLLNYDTRPQPKSALSHLIGKLFFQNKIIIFFLKQMMRRLFTRISVKPGNAFKFNGAVCLHGNMPLKNGVRRSVLIHNKMTFGESKLTKLVEAYSQYRVAKK